MTDIRIVTKDGERLEVSNTFLLPHKGNASAEDIVSNMFDTSEATTKVEGGKANLYSRSGSPSKKELKTASGRNARKNHNGHKALRRASNPPAVPKTAGHRAGLDPQIAHTTLDDVERRHQRQEELHRSASPFPQDNINPVWKW